MFTISVKSDLNGKIGRYNNEYFLCSGRYLGGGEVGGSMTNTHTHSNKRSTQKACLALISVKTHSEIPGDVLLADCWCMICFCNKAKPLEGEDDYSYTRELELNTTLLEGSFPLLTDAQKTH